MASHASSHVDGRLRVAVAVAAVDMAASSAAVAGVAAVVG